MFKSRVHVLIASILFTLIVSAYIIMAVRFPMAYIIGTYEDFIGEWIQVFFFAAVMVISARMAFSESRFRIFFALLALAGFYVVGEEISWGQRIFDIDSPEFFRTHNLQRETNIHNFFTGPYGTQLKKRIAVIIAIGFILYGLIYPLALRLRWKIALWIEKRGIPAPPLYLWPFFVCSAFLELGFLSFNEAEVAEMLIPFALSITGLFYWTAYHRDLDVHQTAGDASFSRSIALGTLALFLIVLVLSGAATYASYSSPRIRARMESRLNNGIEKFAGRYRRYRQWDTAARLYHEIDKREPGRASIQRRLATCYEKQGQEKDSAHYLKKALDIDTRRMKRKPENVSSNLSLAKTYRQMGNKEKADQHLDSALMVALKRAEKKPESASAAYWLGKTYRDRGNYAAALKQFQKAFRLKPYISKYRKALFRVQGYAGKVPGTDPGDSDNEEMELAK